MLGKIIFFISVSAAILTVLLLSFLFPAPPKNPKKTLPPPTINPPTLYLHPPCIPSSELKAVKQSSAAGAFIFRHDLTAGPRNTSRVIGKAEGFALPVPVEEYSAFAGSDIVYLTVDTGEYSGGLSLEVKESERGYGEEMAVVGGAGDFAFARGVAVLGQMHCMSCNYGGVVFYMKLRIKFI